MRAACVARRRPQPCPEPPVTACAALDVLLDVTDDDEGLSVDESVGVAVGFAVDLLVVLVEVAGPSLAADDVEVVVAAVPPWAAAPIPKTITPTALSPLAAAEPVSRRRRRRARSRSEAERGGRRDFIAVNLVASADGVHDARRRSGLPGRPLGPCWEPGS
jgi:hypothetical protein